MSLPTKTPPVIPFDKNKNKSVRSASEITTIRKFQADSTYYYNNSETKKKDLAAIYGSSMYPRNLSQSGLTLDSGRLLQGIADPIEYPTEPSSDGSILYSDILTPDAPGYDIMVMAGQSNGVGSNGYTFGTLSATTPTVSGDGLTVTYPCTIGGSLTVGYKAVVTGYAVTGTGFNGTGFLTSFNQGTPSVTIKFPFISSGTATNTELTAFIRFLDFDDQLFLTATRPTISVLDSTTTYTYGQCVGTLTTAQLVGSTVTVQNITLPNSTSIGFNGTGTVTAIDDIAKTITVDIQSSVSGITGASYTSGTGVTTYTMNNNFTNGTTVTISGITVSAGNASLFNISGPVGNATSSSFTITQGTMLANATYFSGGVTSPLPTPIPVTTGGTPSRIVVISPSNVSSKVFTLLGTNNSVTRAFDPLPQTNGDLYSGGQVQGGRGSLVTFGCNYASSGYLRSTSDGRSTSNRRVLLVQTSMSGNSFRILDNSGTGWWQSTLPSEGGACYTNCIKRIQSAMTQTFALDGGRTSLPRNNRIVAVCWQEGEGDIGKSSSAQYKLDLVNFVRNLRGFVSSVSTNTLGLTSAESAVMANTFSFLVGAMNRAADGSPGSDGDKIRLAGVDVGGTTYGGAAVPRAAYVPRLAIGIDDHPEDPGVHYSGTDQKIMGDQYYTGLNSVVTAYSGISTVTSGTVKRFTSRRVSTLTTNWVLTSPSDVTVDIFISGTASSKYGFLLDSGPVSSGTTSAISIYKPIDNVYYYAVITPKTATLNGVPFTTSAVLSVPVDDKAPTVASPSISIQSQKLVATWSTSKPCASLVEFFSNSTNSASDGTLVSGVTVLPNTMTATIPNALVSRLFYYAVVTPAGGSPVTSGTVQQPITPILQTSFSTTLSVVGSIAPVATTTITGSIAGGANSSNQMTVTAGVATIGQRLSLLSNAGNRPVYIVSAQPPAASYIAVLSEAITGRTAQSITLTGCGLLTVTSGTPVAGALLTSGASAGTRIVGPTPDPNVWVVSQSQTVAAGTTFVFSGPVDTSPSNKQFKLVFAEGSQPSTFPLDPIMNSVVYNGSSSFNTAGVSPFIGVLGGFPGGSFTKMCWYRMETGSPSNVNLIGTSATPLYMPSTGLVRHIMGSTFSSSDALNNRLTDTIWAHVAATYDASTNQGTVYVNGLKDSATVYSYPELTNLFGSKPFLGSDNIKYSYGNLSIAGYDGAVGQFRGSLDDIRVYTLALTDDEILSVYNSKTTVTNLQTTANTANTISLSWTPPSGVTVTDYRIQQSTDEGSNWSDSTFSNLTSNSVTVTNLVSLDNSRIALKVAPVVGGVVGKSEVINTSTEGSAIFRLVGGNGSAVVDTVTGRTLTAVTATLSGSNVVTGTGVSRNVITIPFGGYVTIGGNMPAGSHSFCFWMKATAAYIIFEYSAVRGSGGAVSTPSHSITEHISGLSSSINVIDPFNHTHKAKTLRVLDGGIIECEAAHGFTENTQIIFESSYFGPNPSGTATSNNNSTTFITGNNTTYFVRYVSPTRFALMATSGAAENITRPPVGPFIAGVYTAPSVTRSNNWFHFTSVFDQIKGTTTVYQTNSVGNVSSKTLVPRVWRSGADKVVFPAATRGAFDLFQIGRYSVNTGQTTGLIDDFRAYAKALSPPEIAQIVAGSI